MNFGWESDSEKLRRHINIPPRKRLEWLQKMHDLLLLTATPKRKRIFWELRGIKR